MAIWKSSRLLRKRQKSLNSSKVMPIASWRRSTSLSKIASYSSVFKKVYLQITRVKIQNSEWLVVIFFSRDESEIREGAKIQKSVMSMLPSVANILSSSVEKQFRFLARKQLKHARLSAFFPLCITPLTSKEFWQSRVP